MSKKVDKSLCCTPSNVGSGCCNVEAVISIDERGQLVLPKEVRDKVKIQKNDKLVVVSMSHDEEICCIALIKADRFGSMVKNFLNPMMNEIVKGQKE